jgi:hypothetical protein
LRNKYRILGLEERITKEVVVSEAAVNEKTAKENPNIFGLPLRH